MSSSASTLLCPKCSAELPASAAFCMRCGTPTRQAGGEHPGGADGDSEAIRRSALQTLLGDGFVLRGKLGSGGFADVYEAWDVRLKRSVAIKTLRADLDASESLIERFRREAEAIAMLRHPNVIPIYVVGGDASTAYFVMPKVDGESLAVALERDRRFSVDEARRILIETASALETAHAAGVVHRDIKPENILLDGPKRRVLVTDFGIAKSLGAEGGALTGTGIAIGTPEYMSPEQATGDKHIDHRTDQYSLAIVGYRMLSGQLPFAAESMQAMIMRQILEPPRPLHEVAPEVPQDLSAVLQRALQKEQVNRYASTEDFLRALEDTRRAGAAPSRRMPIADLAPRVTQLQRDLTGWKWKAAGAIAAMVVGTALVAMTESSAALTATNGHDAVFAARKFINARDSTSGALRDRARYHTLDQAHRTFLTRSVPRDMERLARTEIPLQDWQVQLRERGGADARAWMVHVGPEGRIMGHHRLIHDSVSASPLSAPAAESAAVAELRRFGHDPARLRREADSTVKLEHRTDQVLTWSRPGSAISWKGSTDSSRSQLRVKVMGDGSVTAYDETLRLPARYPAENSSVVTALTVLSVLGGIVLMVLALVTQARHDELRWGIAWRVAALIMTIGILPAMLGDLHEKMFLRGTGAGAVSMEALSSGALLVALLGLIAAVAVIVESLSAELRPRAFAGFEALAYGRFATPEFARAMAHALLWAGVILLVHGVDSYANFRLVGDHRGPDFGDIVTGPIRAVQAVSETSASLVVALVCGAVQLVILRWVRMPVVAVTAPILIMAAFALARTEGIVTPGGRLMDIVNAGLVSVIVWRSGILAGGMALALAMVLPDAVTVARYADGGILPGLACVAVVAAPLALGVVAYRRLTVRGARAGERPATV